MERSKVTDTVQTILRSLFNDDTIIITNRLSANDIKEWDSLNNIMFFVEIEKAFNIHFRSSEITRIENVGKLIDLIMLKLHN